MIVYPQISQITQIRRRTGALRRCATRALRFLSPLRVVNPFLQIGSIGFWGKFALVAKFQVIHLQVIIVGRIDNVRITL